MSICLSHQTALTFWRIVSILPEERARCILPCISSITNPSLLTQSSNRYPWTPSHNLEEFKPSHKEIGMLSTLGFCALHNPVDVLVPDGKSRTACKGISNHIASLDLPGKHIIKLSNSVYVVSPELCFLQMAAQSSEAKLSELGCEFCGRYRKIDSAGIAGLSDGDATRGFMPAIPITSAERLEKFLCRVSGFLGTRTARKLAPYVVDGSESPMETSLMLLLCLPARLGGFGLPTPTFNSPFEVDAIRQRTTSKRGYRFDLHWPKANLDVEYDSDLCHTGSGRIAEDSMRRNSISYLGLEVVTATRKQIMDQDECIKLARIIAKKLQVRFRPRGVGWDELNRELRAQVLPIARNEGWHLRY